ncbi:MAG: NAD(P)-binding domain-containing protein [Planctomycetota bacterium]
MTTVDAVVVGAGPIGIEVHAALRAAGASVRHIEAGAIGHTMTWWAPKTTFFSSPERISVCGIPLAVPGQAKATGDDYVEYLVGVVRQLGLPIETFRRVTDIRKADRGFDVAIARSSEGVGGQASINDRQAAEPVETIATTNVILCSGNMHGPRMVEIPGEGLPHVSHYLADPLRYVARKVLIVGGKNSAVEAAIRLHRAGASVTVAHRQPDFDDARVKPWLLPELRWLIDKGRIRYEPSAVPVSIDADRSTFERDGTAFEIGADDVLLLTGYVQDQSLFDRLGLERLGDEHRPRFDRETMQTSVPGVYVAGTACGGSQRRARVFIENSHVHADRICRAITGKGVPWALDPEFSKLGSADEER